MTEGSILGPPHTPFLPFTPIAYRAIHKVIHSPAACSCLIHFIDDVLTHHQRLDWKNVRDLAAQPTHTSTNGRAATRRPSTLI